MDAEGRGVARRSSRKPPSISRRKLMDATEARAIIKAIGRPTTHDHIS